MKPRSSKLLYKIDVTIIVGAIFMLVGISFLIASVLIIRDSTQFYREAVSTEGIISDIYLERKDKSDVHRVIVSYQADSKPMTGRLDYYSSTMRIGDPVTLYYRPDNPSRVRGGASSLLDWIFPGAGLLAVLLGSLLVVFPIRKLALNKKLLASGMRLSAVITDVRIKRNESVNGRHPYVVDCEYLTPGGAVYVFSSGALWDRPTDDAVGSVVHVYVDPQNYRKYYLDVSTIPALPVYVMGNS